LVGQKARLGTGYALFFYKQLQHHKAAWTLAEKNAINFVH
jgi:hypothetical protein